MRGAEQVKIYCEYDRGYTGIEDSLKETMFTKDANQEVDAFILFHWLLMIACAGVMNAVAFIGLGTFATHVTGFATLFGVHAAHFEFVNAIAALAVPLFFLAGSIISGLCVEARVRQGKVPYYDYVMYACSLLLLVACFIGNVKEFNPGEGALHLSKNFVLLSLICLSSGLMNAALSYSSHSTLRITHLTGVMTDLGRGIAEMISLRTVSGMRREVKLNLQRGLTIVAFTIGSLVGAVLFRAIDFSVLILPAVYLAYAGNHGRKLRSDHQAQMLLRNFNPE